MKLTYLPEHVENARIALTLARKEASHLKYTRDTLYQQNQIDIAWVLALEDRQDIAEKIDAFVSRFGRLQDHIGEKLIPRFAALMGESPKSLLDVISFAEEMGWVKSAEGFIAARRLRNLLVHEYMADPALFCEALLSAENSASMLISIVDRLTAIALELDIIDLEGPGAAR